MTKRTTHKLLRLAQKLQRLDLVRIALELQKRQIENTIRLNNGMTIINSVAKKKALRLVRKPAKTARSS